MFRARCSCWDFPNNGELIALLEALNKEGKVVSAVCHGPNGLVNVKGTDGKPLVAGKKVSLGRLCIRRRRLTGTLGACLMGAVRHGV